MKMRRLLALSSLLLIGIGGASLLACGDKILVPTRGTRFDLTPSTRRKAAVLVHMSPSSSMPALFDRLSLMPILQKAGYQLTMVSNDDELFGQLKRHHWDVVLVSLGDIPLRSAPQTVAPSPVVLAVAVNVTKASMRDMDGQYSRILKSPGRSEMVEAFDAAVATSNDRAQKLSRAGS